MERKYLAISLGLNQANWQVYNKRSIHALPTQMNPVMVPLCIRSSQSQLTLIPSPQIPPITGRQWDKTSSFARHPQMLTPTERQHPKLLYRSFLSSVSTPENSAKALAKSISPVSQTIKPSLPGSANGIKKFADRVDTGPNISSSPSL